MFLYKGLETKCVYVGLKKTYYFSFFNKMIHKDLLSFEKYTKNSFLSKK